MNKDQRKYPESNNTKELEDKITELEIKLKGLLEKSKLQENLKNG